MKCPYCNHSHTRVTETRATGEGDRRYRLCLGCSKSFTTMERVTIFLGPKTGWRDLTVEPHAPSLALVPPPDPVPGQAPDAEPKPKVARTSRYRASTDDPRLCVFAQPVQSLLVEWWNEARWSKHKAKATWTEAAWVASVKRVEALGAFQRQLELCQAGVEHGWQALKEEYLGTPSRLSFASSRPMPKDPAMLAALEEPWPA